ncbi:hypothetical protein ABG067_007257 [Albugo candida]
MMDPLLIATEYDVIILGTGIVESILAGAFARIGKTVLHCDPNDYYGSNYATLNMNQFSHWLDSSDLENMNTAPNYQILAPRLHVQKISKGTSFTSAKAKESLTSQSTRFNLDVVSPKLLFAAGELVQLLISSGVGRYLEFTALERSFLQITTWKDEELIKTVSPVPCSKKDVFQSDLLSVTEKRTLMKFLQFVADIGDIRFKGECLETKNERDLALGRSLQ